MPYPPPEHLRAAGVGARDSATIVVVVPMPIVVGVASAVVPVATLDSLISGLLALMVPRAWYAVAVEASLDWWHDPLLARAREFAFCGALLSLVQLQGRSVDRHGSWFAAVDVGRLVVSVGVLPPSPQRDTPRW